MHEINRPEVLLLYRRGPDQRFHRGEQGVRAVWVTGGSRALRMEG